MVSGKCPFGSCDCNRRCCMRFTLKGPVCRRRDMNPRRPDIRTRQDCAGQFPLFRPPVGRIKHLRRCPKPRKAIQKLVALGIAGRQSFRGQRHPQHIPCRTCDIDRVAAYFIGDAPLFEGSNHLARGIRFQPRIKQRKIGRANAPRQSQNGGKNRQRGQNSGNPAACVQFQPDGQKAVQDNPPDLTGVLPGWFLNE